MGIDNGYIAARWFPRIFPVQVQTMDIQHQGGFLEYIQYRYRQGYCTRVVSQNISSIGIDKDIAAGWFPRIYLVQVKTRILQQGGFLEYFQYSYRQWIYSSRLVSQNISSIGIDKDIAAGWFPRIFPVQKQTRIYRSMMASYNISNIGIDEDIAAE